ncbi:MAG: hypothetical protein QM582_12260 [Micropruina sp.]|uniref:hypothetical protein n=1 Tax=Micropruina sp. TaxID=2737536 RepID=UPI0039E6B145
MSIDQGWVSDAQYRCIRAGLRVLSAWTRPSRDPDAALGRALRYEPDGGQVVVGLATVARLLAMELAAATGRTEQEVLTRTGATVERLQYTSANPGAE